MDTMNTITITSIIMAFIPGSRRFSGKKRLVAFKPAHFQHSSGKTAFETSAFGGWVAV